jgi:tight junction protein 1
MQPPSRQNLPPKQHRYDMVSVTPEPPELKPKKNPLKSPLKALKSAIVKGTKSLRRQASFMESSESKKQRSLRRQHSMMERGSNRMFYSPQHHPQQQQQQMQMQQQPQDYYEYQQQQYYNYYNNQPRYPHDERYAWYQRHERYYPANGPYADDEPLYGNYGPPPNSQHHYQHHDENIYANRALIELERPTQKPSGGRIIRRHSMNERHQVDVPAFATLTKPRRRSKYVEDVDENFSQMTLDEPIYQSQRGSLMYHEQMMKPRASQIERRQFYEQRSIEDNQKLPHLNSPTTSSTSTPTSTSISSPSKERNYRDSRRQLKDQIYQSRIDAMQSMAEPNNYLTRSSSGTSTNIRSQPIYESKKEMEEDNNDVSRHTSDEVDTSNENNEQEKSLLEAIEETILKNKSQDHLNENHNNDDDEEIEEGNQNIPFADDETIRNNENTIDESDGSLQRTAIENPKPSPRDPNHISSIIKRAAPPPIPIRSPTTTKSITDPVYESHTSIDTQASLPIGPPNAQSTPYASELTLKEQKNLARARFLASPPVRQPITTKGYFDEEGGMLEDKVWNVSLIIPPGAIPVGVKQEIYFTVTDPRISESVGGPPLDMENGWLTMFLK